MIRRRTGEQDGFVAVLVIIVLLVGVLISSAVVLQATSTEGSVRRDGSSKRAVEAARAGIGSATTLAISTASTSWTTAGKECPTRSATGSVTYSAIGTYSPSAVTPSVWCPAVTQQIGSGESYTYQLSQPYTPTGSAKPVRDIVTTGIVTAGEAAGGKVTRRLRRTLAAVPGAGTSPFAAAGVIGLDSVTLTGGAYIGQSGATMNVATAGTINLDGGVKIYGAAAPGVGKSFVIPNWATPATFVTGATTATTTNPQLSDVTIPTSTDDAQLATFNGTRGWSWTSATRVLSLTQDANVTVTGNTFVLCSLYMDGATRLNFTPSPAHPNDPIRVYFDSCPGVTNPISIIAGAHLGVTGSPYVVQAYVAGSATITISGGASGNFGLLDAPHAAVTLTGGGALVGVVAAKSVYMDGGTNITAATNVGPVDASSGGSTTYTSGTLVECTSNGGTSSLTGC